jgi:hypothetical protein
MGKRASRKALTEPKSRQGKALQSAAGADLASLHQNVLSRIGDSLLSLVEASTRAHLYEALSRKTGIDTLIHLLAKGDAVAEAASQTSDPLRAARARAAKHMSELLLAEGGPLGVQDVATLLRISRAAVDKRRRQGTLIGIADGGRSVKYPGWQFTATGLLPGLEETLRHLSINDPWVRIEFFLSKDPDLGTKPLDALRKGRRSEVTAAAKRFGRLGEDA